MARSRVGICFLDRPHPLKQVKYAQMAEQKGYECVWVCETRLAMDAFTILGAIGANTERIKLGTGIVNTWNRKAALMAMTFATLDEITMRGGRVVAGLGAYWDPLAWKQGIDRRKPLKQMREYVEVMRRLLALERVTYEGELVQVRDLELDLGHGLSREPKRIPIYIGATGDKMLELSGEIADGVLLNANVSVAYTRSAIDHIRKGAERVGRSLSDLEFPILLTVGLNDRDRDQAMDEARELITMYLGQQPHVGIASGLPEEYVKSVNEAMGGWPPRPGGVRKAMKLVGDDVVNMLTVAGNADDVIRRAREYVAAGATYVIPLVTSDNVSEIIEAFAEV